MSFTAVKKKTVFLLLLITGLAFSVSFSYAATNKDIEKSKASISGNQEKIKQLEERQSQLKTEMEKLKSEKADTAAFISELDTKQQQLKESAELLHQEIEITETEIETTKGELKEAQEQLDRQKETMGIRIRYMYEYSQSDLLELLLQSESLAELLNNVEYIQKVNQFDREKLQQFKEQAAAVEQKKKELESEKLVLMEQQNTLKAELESVELMQTEKQQQIIAFEQEINSASEQNRQLREDVAKLNAAIKEEEKRIANIEAEIKRKEEEARKKAMEQQKAYKTQSIGDLDLKWPVPSSSRVTSYFGDREAPVEGASTNHKGIDIAADSGEKVIASESGTVVIATYSESAGNYCMISHGGGIYTVYMHLSSINVSENEEVKRGSVIGYVGSTGYSTGPHLHFGLRINGEYVNPLGYVAP